MHKVDVIDGEHTAGVCDELYLIARITARNKPEIFQTPYTFGVQDHI